MSENLAMHEVEVSPGPEALRGASPAPGVADAVAAWLGADAATRISRETAAWGLGEWADARRAALVHGVAPLLAARLDGTAAWLALAPELRAYCAEQLALNGQRVALMRADLAAILDGAAHAGVELLPLKGAVLVEHYYPDPALRPMADLDLLVRPEAVEPLHRVMLALGYRPGEQTPRHRVYIRGEPRVVSWDGEHPDNPRGVEVHTAVGERLRAIAYDITPALRAGASERAFGGAVGLAPAPEALLLHLLIHTCHNIVNRRLRAVQLYDLALVAPHLSDAGWEWLVDDALRAGEARLLYAPLALAERLFGPLAPPIVRERLARETPAALRAMLAHTTPSQVSLCDRREASPAFKLAWYRHGAEWLGALLRVALPAPAELRQRYPSATGGLPGAYARHAGHTAGWALRAALGRERQRVRE